MAWRLDNILHVRELHHRWSTSRPWFTPLQRLPGRWDTTEPTFRCHPPRSSWSGTESAVALLWWPRTFRTQPSPRRPSILTRSTCSIGRSLGRRSSLRRWSSMGIVCSSAPRDLRSGRPTSSPTEYQAITPPHCHHQRLQAQPEEDREHLFSLSLSLTLNFLFEWLDLVF